MAPQRSMVADNNMEERLLSDREREQLAAQANESADNLMYRRQQ